MDKVSALIASLSESETLAMSQKSNELKAKGVDVINLSVGEPDFPTPQHVKDAAKKAIDDNFTKYTPVPGYLSLREAIQKKLKTENKLNFSTNQIVCSNGAKQSVCNALLSILNPQDEIIIPTPCWVSYIEMVKLTQATPVLVTTTYEQDYKMTAKQLEESITPKTKALLICSPSNPTGSIYSQSELKDIVDVLVKYPNILVLSDEIYEHINYVGQHTSIAQFDEMKDRVIIINGVSKAYSMTGWRLGWMAAPKWIADACNKLQGQYTSGCSSIAQKAAEAAYLFSNDCVETMRVAFVRRKDLITQLVSTIKGLKLREPQGAFYIFPDCSFYLGKQYQGKRIETSSELSLLLLDEAHVASVGGEAFKSPNNIRFSYATSDENIIEAMHRVKLILDQMTD